MKAKIEAAFVEQFKPFDLVITFESKLEAQAFWHRMNIPFRDVRKSTSNMRNQSCVMSLSKEGDKDEAWEGLNEYMTKNNLKTD